MGNGRRELSYLPFITLQASLISCWVGGKGRRRSRRSGVCGGGGGEREREREVKTLLVYNGEECTKLGFTST